MAAPEITPYGLTIQTFDEAFAALAQEVRNALGQQIAADSPTSVIGVLNGIVARLSASNQEGLQGVYLARTLDGASGTDLDRIGQILSIPRKGATQSVVTITFANSSASNINIPAQRILQIAGTTYQFTTPDAVFTVPASGNVDAQVTAIDTGTTPVNALQDWQWVSSFTGSTSITMTNADPGTEGANVESDTAYRLRLATEHGLNGAATLDAIYTALSVLALVQECAVFANDTDSYGISTPRVVPGVPPHAIASVVRGTMTDASVAQTLFAKKAAGIATFGNTSFTVYDAQGMPYPIHFQTGTQLPIYVTAHVTAIGVGTNDAGTIAAIKNAISAYGETLALADTVVYVKVACAITDAVASITGLTMTMGIAPSPSGVVNIVPDWDQAPTFDQTNMIITVN